MVVVTEPIPPSNEKTDKEALKHYELLRLPMPLAPMPRPDALRRRFQKLASEFPWATTAIAQLEDALWPTCLLGVKKPPHPAGAPSWKARCWKIPARSQSG